MGGSESRCCTDAAEKRFEKNSGTEVGRCESRYITPTKALSYDPRSPSQSIDRTPIEIAAPAIQIKPLMSVQPLPENNIRKRNITQNTTIALEPQFPGLGTPTCLQDKDEIQTNAGGKHVAEVLDPRSPSQGVVRTPLLVEESREMFYGQSIADALVVCETPKKPEKIDIGEINFGYSSDVDPIAQDPYDPRSPSENIKRTPLGSLEKPEHYTEVNSFRNLQDPRSPTTEVSRTPVAAMFSGHRELRRTVLMTNALMASPLNKNITRITEEVQTVKEDPVSAAEETDDGTIDEMPATLSCSFDSNNSCLSSLVASIGSEVDCTSLDDSFEEDQASLNTIDMLEIDMLERHSRDSAKSPPNGERIPMASDGTLLTSNNDSGQNPADVVLEEELDGFDYLKNEPQKMIAPLSEFAETPSLTTEKVQVQIPVLIGMGEPDCKQKVSESSDINLQDEQPSYEGEDHPFQPQNRGVAIIKIDSILNENAKHDMDRDRMLKAENQNDVDIQMVAVLNDLVATSCSVKISGDAEPCTLKAIVNEEKVLVPSVERTVNTEDIFVDAFVQDTEASTDGGTLDTGEGDNQDKKITGMPQQEDGSKEGNFAQNLNNLDRRSEEEHIITDPCHVDGEATPKAVQPEAEEMDTIISSIKREVQKVVAPKATVEKPQRKLRTPMPVTYHKRTNGSPNEPVDYSAKNANHVRRSKSKSATDDLRASKQFDGENTRRPIRKKSSRKSESKLAGPGVVRSPLTVLTNEANPDKGQVSSPSNSQRVTKLPRYQVAPPGAGGRSLSVSFGRRPAARSQSVDKVKSGQRSLSDNKEN